MLNLIAVGFGGFFGAICRFYISELIGEVHGFPFATLLTNWIGSLLLAFIFTPHTRLSIRWKIANNRFLGAFTTFSTFTIETVQLLTSGAVILAVMYIEGVIGNWAMYELPRLYISERRKTMMFVGIGGCLGRFVVIYLDNG